MNELVAALPPTETSAQKRKATAAAATAQSPKAARRKQAKRTDDPNAPSIEAVEIIDLVLLRALYAQRDTLISKKQGQQQKFHNYYTNTIAANGTRTVRYMQKLSGEKFGRFSPCNGLSFQNMDHTWRDTLVRDRTGALLYEQLDMRKAHQSILLSVAENSGWETPRLRYYVENSDTVLDMFVFERDKAKTAMLMLLYGGNASMASGFELPSFVEAYRVEMKELAQKLYATHPDLVRRLSGGGGGGTEMSEQKRVFVFMSRFLQDYEAKCMQSAVEFLVGAGWKIGGLLHDGIMVRRRADVRLDDAVLARLTTHIFEKCKIRGIELRLKEFGPPLPVDLAQH